MNGYINDLSRNEDVCMYIHEQKQKLIASA